MVSLRLCLLRSLQSSSTKIHFQSALMWWQLYLFQNKRHLHWPTKWLNYYIITNTLFDLVCFYCVVNSKWSLFFICMKYVVYCDCHKTNSFVRISVLESIAVNLNALIHPAKIICIRYCIKISQKNAFCSSHKIYFWIYLFSILIQWRLKKRDEILAGIGGADKVFSASLLMAFCALSVFTINKYMQNHAL